MPLFYLLIYLTFSKIKLQANRAQQAVPYNLFDRQRYRVGVMSPALKTVGPLIRNILDNIISRFIKCLINLSCSPTDMNLTKVSFRFIKTFGDLLSVAALIADQKLANIFSSFFGKQLKATHTPCQSGDRLL